MSYRIRTFEKTYVDQTLALMHRNFLEVNSRDYTETEIENLIAVNNRERILYTADHSHMYVALEGKEVVGCGAVTCFWDRQDTSVILDFYVSPDVQGKGIGRFLMEALKMDEYYLTTGRTEVSSSITACGFYEKMGFTYPAGERKLDDNRLVPMVKLH